MKIAVAGKGGVGKTTIAGSLARYYADKGYRVVAVDADPDANLASAIGIPAGTEIAPLSKMKDLIKERTGAEPGTIGGFFKLNPKVDDIPERLSVKKDGIRMLVMGSVEHGGSGCVCPESALLRALISHLLLESDEVVIMDMEAGLEHLGRGTADSVDALIVVVEPGLKSIQTAKTIRKLAGEIGIKNIFLVINKVGTDKELAQVKERMEEFFFLGRVGYSEKVLKSDIEGISPYDADSNFVLEIENIAHKLETQLLKST